MMASSTPSFISQQVQLLQSLPSFETLRPEITELRQRYLELHEDEQSDVPSEQSIKKAIKKANDMALQRMRNLHSYRARQETLNQLNIATHPNKGVRIDEDSTMDWQQLPMKWPKDVMEEVDGNGADSHTSEKSTDALRQQYTKLRQKVTSDHEALISLRSEKKQLENLLEITSTIDETMANGGAETITHLEDACQAAQNSIGDLQTALRDKTKRETIRQRLLSLRSLQPEKRAKVTPADILSQLTQNNA